MCGVKRPGDAVASDMGGMHGRHSPLLVRETAGEGGAHTPPREQDQSQRPLPLQHSPVQMQAESQQLHPLQQSPLSHGALAAGREQFRQQFLVTDNNGGQPQQQQQQQQQHAPQFHPQNPHPHQQVSEYTRCEHEEG